MQSGNASFLLISSDNEAFEVVAPKSMKELQTVINEFKKEKDGESSKKDYVFNYNLRMYDLLSRDDDTLIRALWKIVTSVWMIISAIGAAVAAAILTRYASWNCLNIFVVLLIVAFAVHTGSFLYSNSEHYFREDLNKGK